MPSPNFPAYEPPITVPEPPVGPAEPAAPAPSRSGEHRGPLKRIGGWFAAAAILIANLAAKLKGILLVLPKLKLLTTSGSMLVSIAAYSLFFGWTFAVGFVLLLLVHEMGHVLELRRQGIDASAPMFIPFLGAVVAMKEMPANALNEAKVGLAGPVLGSLGALASLGVYEATGNQYWQALAFVGFFLNLFNLLPVLPLDGGRAMAALSPVLWVVGFGMLVAVAVVFPNPIMILIAVFGGMETWRRWKGRNEPETQRYHEVATRDRFIVAVVYLGLAALLAVGMDASFVERSIN